MPFFHTISRDYQFRTVEPVLKYKPNQEDLTQGIRNVINLYKRRNIRISQLNADNEYG